MEIPATFVTPAADLTASGVEPSLHACPECGSLADGPYCSNCGSALEPHRDLRLSHFVRHAVHDLTHFDTTIFRTLKLLVLKPGELSVRSIEGREKGYVKPFQLFLVLNLIFFLLNVSFFQWHYDTFASVNGTLTDKGRMLEHRIAELSQSPEVYRDRFDSKIHSNEKAYLLVLIPVLGLVLQALYVGRRRFFVEHLITVSHFLSFMLLFLLLSQVIIGVPLLLASIVADWMGYRFNTGENTTVIIIFIALTAYLWPALRRTYDDSRIGSFLRAFFVSALIVPAMVAYRELIFWVTYWTT